MSNFATENVGRYIQFRYCANLQIFERIPASNVYKKKGNCFSHLLLARWYCIPYDFLICQKLFSGARFDVNFLWELFLDTDIIIGTWSASIICIIWTDVRCSEKRDLLFIYLDTTYIYDLEKHIEFNHMYELHPASPRASSNAYVKLPWTKIITVWIVFSYYWRRIRSINIFVFTNILWIKLAMKV